MSSVISIGEGAARFRGKPHIVLFYLNLIIKLEQQQMNNDGMDEDEDDGSDDMEQKVIAVYGKGLCSVICYYHFSAIPM